MKFGLRQRMLLLWVLFILISACEKRPEDRLAHGEDRNLFLKTDLIGKKFDARSMNEAARRLFEGIPDKESINSFSFELSKKGSFLDLYKLGGAKSEAVYQWAVREHYDLARSVNLDGKQTQYLVRNTSMNPEREDRAYILVDPTDPRKVKPTDNEVLNLYERPAIANKSFIVGKDKAPFLNDRDLALIKDRFSLADGDILTTRLTENAVVFSRKTPNAVVDVAKIPVSYYDLVRGENADKEWTDAIVKDNRINPWHKRTYVQLNLEGTMVLSASDSKFNKTLLTNSCFASDRAIPVPAISDLLLREKFMAPPGTCFSFVVTKSSLALYTIKDPDATRKDHIPVVVVPIVGHMDADTVDNLTTQQRREGKLKNWHDYEYVALGEPTLVKASDDTLRFLFGIDEFKRDYHHKSFAYQQNELPFVTSSVEAEIARKYPFIKSGQMITGKLMPKEYLLTTEFNGSELNLVSIPLDFYDLVNQKNPDLDPTSAIVLDNTMHLSYAKRRFIKLTPQTESSAVVGVTKSIFKKSEVDGRCFGADQIPLPTVIGALRKGKVAIGSGECIALEASQTILSVYKQKKAKGEKSLVFTMDILGHMDVEFVDDKRTTIEDSGKLYSTWADREYFAVGETFYQTEDQVNENALDKSMFEGEFVYQATVFAADSNNDSTFEGRQASTGTRLKFVFTETDITAYRVNDARNTTEAETPMLRYAVNHFDVERHANSYGDSTHIIIEDRKNNWRERSKVRVGFSQPLVYDVYSDPLLVARFIQRDGVSGSRLISNVTMENGLIMFDTEHTITPNIFAGPKGEAGYSPVSVKIRHAFLRVDNRQNNYKKKEHTRHDMQRFGYFVTEEYGYDQHNRATVDTLKYYIKRFDISDNKKIIYYFNDKFPDDYKIVAREAIAKWNDAFEVATGRADLVEVRDNSGQKIGDPRYNMLVYIADRMGAGPLGYGPSLEDPNTGEILSANAYIYGYSMKTSLYYVGRWYDLVSEKRTPEDFKLGDTSLADKIDADFHAANHNHLHAAIKIANGEELTATLEGLPERSVRDMKKLVDDARPKPLMGSIKEVKGILSHAFREEHKRLDLDSILFTLGDGEAAPKHEHHSVVDAAVHGRGCVYQKLDHGLTSAKALYKAHQGISREEFLKRHERSTIFSTMVHELGHNFGLMHNFKGSIDEANFPADYQESKAKYLELKSKHSETSPLTEEEAREMMRFKNLMHSYRTSSVMDYNDEFEALLKGPGAYDIAAIRFGYADNLERLDGSVIANEDFTTVVDDEMRKNSLLSRKKIEEEAATKLGLKNYAYCSDYDVVDDPTCNRFDSGITMSEIISNEIERYDDWYILNFTNNNERWAQSSNGSFGGVQAMRLARQVADEFVYRSLKADFNPAPQGPFSQKDFIRALFMGHAFLKRIITTPEPGTYYLNDKDYFTKLPPSDKRILAETTKLYVPYGIGKYMTAQAIDEGNFERIISFGIERSKMAALELLLLRSFPAPKYREAGISSGYMDLAPSLRKDIVKTLSGLIRGKRLGGLPIQYLNDDRTAAIAIDNIYDFRLDEDIPATRKASANVVLELKGSTLLETYSMIYGAMFVDTSFKQRYRDYIQFAINPDEVKALGKPVKDLNGDDIPFAVFESASSTETFTVPQTADELSIAYDIAQDALEARQTLQDLEADLVANIESGFDNYFEKKLKESADAVRTAIEEVLGSLREANVAGIPTVEIMASNMRDDNLYYLVYNDKIADILNQVITDHPELQNEVVRYYQKEYLPLIRKYKNYADKVEQISLNGGFGMRDADTIKMEIDRALSDVDKAKANLDSLKKWNDIINKGR